MSSIQIKVNAKDRKLILRLLESKRKRLDTPKVVDDATKHAISDYNQTLTTLQNKLDLKYRHF